MSLQIESSFYAQYANALVRNSRHSPDLRFRVRPEKRNLVRPRAVSRNFIYSCDRSR